MKIPETESDMEVDGDFQTQNMQIEISGHAFSVLSKGLYSDPHKAIVRELACNARDAQVETGLQDKPFDLYLPNGLAPMFKIRDYGPGIAPDMIPTLYTYFKSAKQHTNEMTGFFGLGSKSPFAYTKKFTAVSYHGGKRHHFMVFMNPQGIPATTLMSSEDSTEPTGLEVSFAVELGDINLFHVAAQKALVPFAVKPNLHGVNAKNFWPEETKPFLEGNGWKLYSQAYDYYGRQQGASGPVARMACVDYPLTNVPATGVSKNARAMLGSRVILDFPAGAFEITPAREAVQWTDYSTTNINAKLEEVYDEIVKHVTDRVQNAPSYWLACIESMEYCRNQTLAHLHLRPQWQGKQIVENIKIPTAFKVLQITAIQPRRDYTATTNAASTSEFHDSLNPHRTKFFFADYKGAIHRIEAMVREQYKRGDRCLLIVPQIEVEIPNKAHAEFEKLMLANPSYYTHNHHTKTIKEYINSYDGSKLQAALDAFGLLSSDVVMASNAPQLPRAQSARRSRLAGTKARAFTFKRNGYGEACDRYWDEAEVDLESVSEGVYVEIHKWMLNNSTVTGGITEIEGETAVPERPHAMLEWLKRFEQLGLLIPGPGLVGVKTADIKKFQEAKNWMTIDQFAARELKKYWTKHKDFHRTYHVVHCFEHKQYFDHLEEFRSRYGAQVPDGKFKSMLADVNTVVTDRQRAWAFKRCVDGIVDAAWKAELTTCGNEAQALVDSAVERYPLLPILYNERYSTRHVPHTEVLKYAKLIDNQKGK